MMSCKILHEEYAEVFAFLIHLYIIQSLMDRNVESLYMVAAVVIRQSKRRQCVLCCPCGGSTGYKAVQVTPGCVVCVVLSGSPSDANVYCVVRVLVPVVCKAVQVTLVVIRQSK